MRDFFLRFVLVLAACFVGGCGSQSQIAKTSSESESANASSATGPARATGKPETVATGIPVRFSDVARAAGIAFKHNTGARGLAFMPETMGSGVAFIDFDGDGWQDLYFVNGRHWKKDELEQYRRGKWTKQELRDFQAKRPPSRQAPAAAPLKEVPPPPAAVTYGALYRNNRDGTFSDATRGSGLEVEMYGMGAAPGDFDNDGRDDLYVTGYGRNYLFRNLGRGRFAEVAQQQRVESSGWGTGAAWVDYDKGGRLDLFVCRYIVWTPGLDVYGSKDGKNKGYVIPDLYEGEVSHLFHNEGGSFREVGMSAGIHARQTEDRMGTLLKGKALGVAVCDYNNDGWPDLAVANDTQPNYLFHNNKDGTFSERGVPTGIAFDAQGTPRGGMGIDAGDIDHSNRDSIAIGNFAEQMVGLYLNRGGTFTDIAAPSGAGRSTLASVMFGCAFVDYDNDGWPDVALANGHINDERHIHEKGVTYAELPLLLRNIGPGNSSDNANQAMHTRFVDVAATAGEVWRRPFVGRGLACADWDLDGDLDLVFTASGAAPLLLRNDGGHQNNALRLELRGVKSNRNAIGTLVKFSQERLRRVVRSGSSYLSQSELPLTIGVGQPKTIQEISIVWPSGRRLKLKDVAANQILTIHEDKGLVKRRPFPKRPL